MATPEGSGRCAASRFGLRPTRLAAQRVKEDLHHFPGHQRKKGLPMQTLKLRRIARPPSSARLNFCDQMSRAEAVWKGTHAQPNRVQGVPRSRIKSVELYRSPRSPRSARRQDLSCERAFAANKRARSLMAPLLELDDLSRLLARSPSAIKHALRHNPDDVPPCLQLPGTKLLRWRQEDADAWLAVRERQRSGSEVSRAPEVQM